ncbi:hypothetical protein L484_027451 [Morus notabilis]|uniref:Uncharacterized protein n=1 Tax=Morus notabilis TaxID=981085 RepID=W9SMD4_9ROSA|nr:hypothetical protein L484_027451 [Morus notabilis]
MEKKRTTSAPFTSLSEITASLSLSPLYATIFHFPPSNYLLISQRLPFPTLPLRACHNISQIPIGQGQKWNSEPEIPTDPVIPTKISIGTCSKIALEARGDGAPSSSIIILFSLLDYACPFSSFCSH